MTLDEAIARLDDRGQVNEWPIIRAELQRLRALPAVTPKRVLGYAIVSCTGKVREVWVTCPNSAVAAFDSYPETSAGAPHRRIALVAVEP